MDRVSRAWEIPRKNNLREIRGAHAIQSAAMDADGAVRDLLDGLHAVLERRLRHGAHRHPAGRRQHHRTRLGLVDEEMGRVEGEGVRE